MGGGGRGERNPNPGGGGQGGGLLLTRGNIDGLEEAWRERPIEGGGTQEVQVGERRRSVLQLWV